jgi:hypothetical protein
MIRSLSYAVLWQGAWFAGVMGAAAGNAWLGPVAAIPAVLVAAWQRNLLRPALTALLCGVVVDSALGLSGICTYALGAWDGALPPAWILTLWLLFALALDNCLRWTLVCRWLAASLAALSAPAAYLGGAALGAITLPHGKFLAAAAIAVGYAIATLVIVRCYRPFEPAPQTLVPEVAP